MISKTSPSPCSNEGNLWHYWCRLARFHTSLKVSLWNRSPLAVIIFNSHLCSRVCLALPASQIVQWARNVSILRTPRPLSLGLWFDDTIMGKKHGIFLPQEPAPDIPPTMAQTSLLTISAERWGLPTVRRGRNLSLAAPRFIQRFGSGLKCRQMQCPLKWPGAF